MAKYIGKRLVTGILSLFVLATVTFFLTRVIPASKQDNSNDVLLTLYKGPDLSTSKLEKVIGAMLSTNFKR